MAQGHPQEARTTRRKRAIDGFLAISSYVPLLINSFTPRFSDPDDEIRLMAVIGFRSLGPCTGTSRSLHDLVQLLQNDKVPEIRMNSATAIGGLFSRGSNPNLARFGIPPLIEAMRKDPNHAVRTMACRVFGIGPIAKDAAPFLLEAMKTKDDTGLREAARVSFIAVVCPECKELTPALLAMFKLGIDDYHTEFVVLEALGRIGARRCGYSASCSHLEGQRLTKSPLPRGGSVCFGLHRSKSKCRCSIARCRVARERHLKIEDPRNIWSAVFDGLEGIGSDARTALPTIREIASDPSVDFDIRTRAYLRA